MGHGRVGWVWSSYGWVGRMYTPHNESFNTNCKSHSLQYARPHCYDRTHIVAILMDFHAHLVAKSLETGASDMSLKCIHKV